MARITLSDIRFTLLCLTLLIYGVLGSPTPDNPSFVELVIGIGLVLSVGLTVLPLLFYKPDPSCRWLRLLFFYGMSVVLLIGILSAHSLSLIMRDVLPFLFLCLPLFFRTQIEQSARRERIFLNVCFALGLCFAVRVLAPVYGFLPVESELYYLANSPVLIFTSICLSGMGFMFLTQKPSLRSAAMSATCLGLGVLCIWSMFLDVQRATFGAVMLSIIILMCFVLIKSPLRLIVPVILMSAVGVYFYDVLQEMSHAFAQKTALVGLNSRVEELKAVFEYAASSPVSVLIGQGWGATYHSPAVGMMEVPYTHSFLTYSFLKGGLVMVLLSIMVLISALFRIHNIWRGGNHVLAVALFWALLIPCFLYASHKSLDFGVVLLLIYTLGTPRKIYAQGN